MTEKNRKIFVFALLGAAIIWAAWNLTPLGSAGTDNFAGASDPDPDAVLAGMGESIVRAAPDTLTWGEDPFARRAVVTKRGTAHAQTRFQLSAVSSQGSAAMAVVNGSVVRTGDKVAGWEVVEVAPDAVLLKRGERTRRITMKGQ